MKNILSLQNKLTPDDFAPLDENYFKEESLETEEIGYWKASWIRLKSNKIAMVAPGCKSAGSGKRSFAECSP